MLIACLPGLEGLNQRSASQSFETMIQGVAGFASVRLWSFKCTTNWVDNGVHLINSGTPINLISPWPTEQNTNYVDGVCRSITCSTKSEMATRHKHVYMLFAVGPVTDSRLYSSVAAYGLITDIRDAGHKYSILATSEKIIAQLQALGFYREEIVTGDLKQGMERLADHVMDKLNEIEEDSGRSQRPAVYA